MQKLVLDLGSMEDPRLDVIPSILTAIASETTTQVQVAYIK
jgi:hypothetical protein